MSFLSCFFFAGFFFGFCLLDRLRFGSWIGAGRRRFVLLFYCGSRLCCDNCRSEFTQVFEFYTTRLEYAIFPATPKLVQDSLFSDEAFSKNKSRVHHGHQARSESLRQFIDRFNNESLQLADRFEDFLISAFINGLRHGKLYRDLISKPPHTMTSLLEQADDFARADDADRRKREETRRSDKGKEKEHDHRSGRRSVLDRLGCSRSTRAYSPKRENLRPLTSYLILNFSIVSTTI